MDLSTLLIKKNIIKVNEKKIIDYGIMVIYFNLVNIIGILLVSTIFLKNIIYGFLFLIIFIPIRIVSGGYHCKTAFRCFIAFNSIYLITSNLLLNCKTSIFHLMFLSLILLFLPVHFNMQKQHLKNKQFNKLKAIFVFIILISNFIFRTKVLLTTTLIAQLINIILLTMSHLVHFYKKNEIILFNQ